MPRNRLVFIDVDTQVDFMLPSGSLYVPGAENIIPNLERLRQFAETKGIPVISSMDAHSADDEEFQQFPPHCVKGTPGQKKVPETLLARQGILPNEKQPPLADEEISRYQQWLLEKQKFDLFTNVNADSLLEQFEAGPCVVYGVATEYCVRAAVLGLLQRGHPVELVVDAIREIEPSGGRQALREMQEHGAKFIRTGDVLAARAAA